MKKIQLVALLGSNWNNGVNASRFYRQKCESGKMMNYSEWCSIHSYQGWLKHCNSFRLTKKYITPLIPFADEYYKTNIEPNKKGAKAA